eukprot:5737829-Pyramimonas_sp.AAC.1
MSARQLSAAHWAFCFFVSLALCFCISTGTAVPVEWVYIVDGETCQHKFPFGRFHVVTACYWRAGGRGRGGRRAGGGVDGGVGGRVEQPTAGGGKVGAGGENLMP